MTWRRMHHKTRGFVNENDRWVSAEDFESQRSHGLLSCPVCSDSGIEKLLTAKIGKTDAAGHTEDKPAGSPAKTELPRDLHELIDYVLLNTENVGENFAAEARRIHYKEAPQRGIRGVASPDEARDLAEEGVPVLPLPVPPRKDWH